MKNRDSFILCLSFLLLVLVANGSIITNYNRTDETGDIVRIINRITQEPDLRIIVNGDGSVRHIEDAPTTGSLASDERKVTYITKTGLQLESISAEEAAAADIHNRAWQIPKNSSFFIEQIPVLEDGLPDFDNRSFYSLSATSNTLINIKWIKGQFTPYPVPNPDLPD